jgi:hypothetical protein
MINWIRINENLTVWVFPKASKHALQSNQMTFTKSRGTSCKSARGVRDTHSAKSAHPISKTNQRTGALSDLCCPKEEWRPAPDDMSPSQESNIS